MSLPTVSTKLQWIVETAVREPGRVFTTLAHLIDVDFLKEAFHRTRKDVSPGVDGVTADEYAENLEENLSHLHERLRTGRYHAPPVKRAWLDKDDGGQRPIGMPGFEDKIAQRAVAMIMGAVYEQDFESFSHAFREGHSQHQALSELREKCREIGVAWIVDADVAGFFDNLDHTLLLRIIKKRVNDGAIIRLIGKWLNAGVMEGTTLRMEVKGMNKRLYVLLALCIVSWGFSTSLSGPLCAQQSTAADTTARGSAATIVMNYLAAAGTLDPSATRAFLSTDCKGDMVAEFQANDRSGWSFSGTDTKIVSETINTANHKATVVAEVVFKGGRPPTFMAKTQTLFLVLENGAWKISGMDPAPKTAGPGVMPLSR